MGLELAEVVQAASRRGSLASEEGGPHSMPPFGGPHGKHLRPDEFHGRYPRSRSPSPSRGYQSPTLIHRYVPVPLADTQVRTSPLNRNATTELKLSDSHYKYRMRCHKNLIEIGLIYIMLAYGISSYVDGKLQVIPL